MVKIKICVGSSCYLKGADKLIRHMQQIINETEAGSNIELAGAFCLGNCGDGIAISIDEEINHISTLDEAENIIRELVNKK